MKRSQRFLGSKDGSKFTTVEVLGMSVTKSFEEARIWNFDINPTDGDIIFAYLGNRSLREIMRERWYINWLVQVIKSWSMGCELKVLTPTLKDSDVW